MPRRHGFASFHADWFQKTKSTACQAKNAALFRPSLVSHAVDPRELSEFVESEAHLYRNIPANQLALNKLLINQAYENMNLRTTQLLGTLFDGMTRHTEEAYRWMEDCADKGVRQTIRDRDRPWRDYGEKPKQEDG